jgi:ketosteroid isomerase-like protein
MKTQLAANDDPTAGRRRALINAALKGDIDTIVSLACDDIVAMSPNETTLYGKAEWKEWWEEYFQYFRIVALTESDRDVTCNGDFMIEVSGYMVALDAAGGGGRIRDDGRWLTIWKREADGSWRISQTMWNSVRPIGSGTNRYISRLMQKKARGKK